MILNHAVLLLLFVVPHWLELIPFNIAANMQMAISIYRTFDSYPLLIRQKSRAGPCQSNSLSPHNNTNVFPLCTVQLIKGKFVERRICGSQEGAGHGFSQDWPRADLPIVCLHSSHLHKIMQMWKCTQQTCRVQCSPAPLAEAILSTRAAVEWKAQHRCLWMDDAGCVRGSKGQVPHNEIAAFISLLHNS